MFVHNKVNTNPLCEMKASENVLYFVNTTFRRGQVSLNHECSRELITSYHFQLGVAEVNEMHFRDVTTDLYKLLD